MVANIAKEVDASFSPEDGNFVSTYRITLCHKAEYRSMNMYHWGGVVGLILAATALQFQTLLRPLRNQINLKD